MLPTTVVTPIAAGEPRLPDVLQFMQALWAVVHGLDTTSKRMSHAIGVTGPQRLVLRVVGLFPGLSAGDLASILHIHASTVTGILQRLMAQGLLQRLDDPLDRRRAILSLTSRGVQANTMKAKTVEAAVAAALTGVGDRDRAATINVLQRLATALNDAAPEARAQRSKARPPVFAARTRR